MDWEVVPRDEQETIINIDYCEKTIDVYTTRKQVGKRLEKRIGEPTTIYSGDNKIYAVNYRRNLFDKDVAKFFSKMLLIGAFRDDMNEEEQSIKKGD